MSEEKANIQSLFYILPSDNRASDSEAAEAPLRGIAASPQADARLAGVIWSSFAPSRLTIAHLELDIPGFARSTFNWRYQGHTLIELFRNSWRTFSPKRVK